MKLVQVSMETNRRRRTSHSLSSCLAQYLDRPNPQSSLPPLINASDINTIFVHNQSLNANGISLSPFFRCGTIHMHLPATTLQRARPPYRVDQLPTSGQRRRSITDAEIPRDFRAHRLHSAAPHAFFPQHKNGPLGEKCNSAGGKCNSVGS